jgi:TetR/AcrR family transcriptional regulator, transcriptional repressor for nem operon
VPEQDTRTKILDAAQELVQRIGANAMSYQHISQAVGIRKASIHHHFPTKENLLEAVIERYSAYFLALVRSIVDGRGDAPAKLRRYIALFEATLEGGNCDRACPMGMLGAEQATLGDEAVDAIRRFREENEKGLERILEQGRGEGSLRFHGPPRAMAALIHSLLEGELMLARGREGRSHFQTVASQLMRLAQK